MRKTIIWTLVVLLALGFVYTGDNLLNVSVKKTTSFPVQYLPQSDIAIVSHSGDSAVSELFPSLSHSLPQANKNSEAIYLYKNPSSEVKIEKSEDTNVSPLDKLLSFFHGKGFSTDLYWENGFPVVDAAEINKEFFSSVWRSWVFVSSDKDSLRNTFSAVLQKGALLKNNPDFNTLWNPQEENDTYGIVFENAKDVFTEKLSVPFLNFSYPLFFAYNKNKKEFTVTNTDSAPEGSLFFKPFDFEGSALEIAEPEANTIKKFIIDSGLQMIISEKIGIPFKNYSLFSSMNSGEFVLFSKNDFLFTVKSTPINNNIYRSEIMRFIPQVKKTVEEKVNNSLITTYTTPNLRFFTLETPSMFIISNRKNALAAIANKTVRTLDTGNASEFISTDGQFNDIATLYNLNVNNLSLPSFANACIVTKTKTGNKLITKVTLK